MSNKKKRTREDDDIDQEIVLLALELGCVLEKGIDVKMKALERVRDCVDHGDPMYRNQQILVENDVVHYVMELLVDDEYEAVCVKSASLIAVLTDHCASSKVRLQDGVKLSLENQSCRLQFNPVQSVFIEAGAIDVLVPWMFDSRPIKSDTAHEAISAITSYNKDGKLNLLESLGQCLESGQLDALDIMDSTIFGMEISEDLVECIQPSFQSILQLLSAMSISSEKHVIMALGFVATVAEHLKALRQEALESNHLNTLMQYLLFENIGIKDAAVNAVWQIAGGEQIDDSQLQTALEALNPAEIRASLLSIIRLGEEEDTCVDYNAEAKKILHGMNMSESPNEEEQGTSATLDRKTSCALM
eukprot:jgi/Picsp_1/6328/NSC_03677-R1_hypothetical protein CHLNCDRAFT_145475 [Chlorella variabilis]